MHVPHLSTPHAMCLSWHTSSRLPAVLPACRGGGWCTHARTRAHLQVWIVARGMESIKALEKYSAPLLIALSGALLYWAVTSAGGMGPMLSTPSQFGPGMPKDGQFWNVFWPAVTANVGYW